MIRQKAAPDEATILALGLLNASIAAQVGALLQVSTPAAMVMNILIEHLAKILSLVEPEQTRNAILDEIRRNLPAVLNRHVEARMTTPGGVYVPPAGTQFTH